MAKESEKWFVNPLLSKILSIITNGKIYVILIAFFFDVLIMEIFIESVFAGAFFWLLFPVIILILLLFSIFFNKVLFVLYMFIVRFPAFHPVIRLYLMHQSNLKIKKVLQYKQLHLLTHYDWKDLKLVLLLLRNNRKNWNSICPYGQDLINTGIQSKFSNDSLKKFLNFYQTSLSTLIRQVLTSPSSIKKISHPEISKNHISRLVYELTPDQHKHLEQKLAHNHPVLVEIQKNRQIKVKDDLNILM